MSDWADKEAQKLLTSLHVPVSAKNVAAALRKAKAAGLRDAANLIEEGALPAQPMKAATILRLQAISEELGDAG